MSFAADIASDKVLGTLIIGVAVLSVLLISSLFSAAMRLTVVPPNRLLVPFLLELRHEGRGGVVQAVWYVEHQERYCRGRQRVPL